MPAGDLEIALRGLLEEAERQGVPGSLIFGPDVSGSHDELVYVTVRELVGNVVRDANASVVEVSLSRTEDGLLVEVCDDGTGIAPAAREAALRSRHIGLPVIEERVTARAGASSSRAMLRGRACGCDCQRRLRRGCDRMQLAPRSRKQHRRVARCYVAGRGYA